MVDNVAQGGSATLLFADFSAGSTRYWTGTAWSTTTTPLPMTNFSGVHRYVLEVPEAWAGLVIQVVCSLPGQPDLADEIIVESVATVYGGSLS